MDLVVSVVGLLSVAVMVGLVVIEVGLSLVGQGVLLMVVFLVG